MSITLNFKVSGGKEFSVSVDTEITVKDLKEKCVGLSDIPLEAQKIIYKGKILKDKEKLSFYNMQDGHTLHLIKSAIPPKDGIQANTGDASKTADATSTTNDTGNVPSQGTSAGTYNNQMPDLGNSPFADLLNNMSGRMNNNSSLGDQNNLFNSMFNSPMARYILNEMANNPEMMSNLFNNADLLRSAMGDNPQFDQLLQNPNFLRDSLSPDLINATLNSLSNPQPNNMNMPLNNFGDLSAQFEQFLGSMGNMNNRGTGNLGADGGNMSGNAGANGLNALMNPELIQSVLQNLRNNPNLAGMNFNGMNQNMGMNTSGVSANSQPADNRPLEEVYESQLKSLQEMGFIDVAANIQALQETGGDINATVTRLLEKGFN